MQLSQFLTPTNDPCILHDHFIKKATQIMPEFIIDDDNKSVIDQLCFYFTLDSRFSGDLKKGICLAGPVGTGKSFMMKIFIELMNTLPVIYIFKSSLSVVEDFLTGGMPSIKNSSLGPGYKYGYCYDDIGSEPFESKYMGNCLGVMSYLITKRYEAGGPYRNIFFTSNLGKSQIETAYGTRVKSRMVEMVNFIHLMGNDRRQ